MVDLSESPPEDHDKMVKKSQPVKRGKKYIPPTTENFKRSKKGFQLMVQELRKALEDQAKRMPSKSLLNTDKTKVAYKHQSQKGTIDMRTLLKKAPPFFGRLLRWHAQTNRVCHQGAGLVPDHLQGH